MERYGNRFQPLGEIAAIRFGVKSGCDAFFMPRDVFPGFWKSIQSWIEQRAADDTVNELKSNLARSSWSKRAMAQCIRSKPSILRLKSTV